MKEFKLDPFTEAFIFQLNERRIFPKKQLLTPKLVIKQ